MSADRAAKLAQLSRKIFGQVVNPPQVRCVYKRPWLAWRPSSPSEAVNARVCCFRPEPSHRRLLSWLTWSTLPFSPCVRCRSPSKVLRKALVADSLLSYYPKHYVAGPEIIKTLRRTPRFFFPRGNNWPSYGPTALFRG